MSAIPLKTVSIGDLGKVITGKTPPTSRPELFGNEHPFITPTDIDGVNRSVVTERFVSDAGLSAFKNQVIPAGAVCFVCIGATIGKMCVSNRVSLTNQQINSIVVNESRHDPTFVFYALRALAPNVKALAGGAATPIISKSSFSEIKLRVPALGAQRRMGSILSAYDDLIENNTRRIAILEEMARRIYEEWFVRFRFPGHDNVRMVESELGQVPDGWTLTTLKEVCVPNNGIQTGPFGSQLHKSDYSDEGVPVLMPKDLIGFRIETATIARIPEELADRLARHRMKPGDIVYGRRGDIGRRAYIMPNQTGWFCGTGCLRIRPDASRINGWYVFNFIGQENVVGLIAGRAHGVTMANLNARLMDSIPVLCPPTTLQDRYQEVTFPMISLREKLSALTENLRSTRDLLLPKLISGELDVSSLPKLEAAVA